eukprot:TRINITY_DN11141_c0_g1_i2.p1 TRINITY_DN11141_c0_g1~~TRINITY_DN11141_c0_g1_i2.p1  ORF type:complete len:394 (-),score=70.51 TRINITY_DN11141_c0_g1_i2:459-1640(-)
MCLWALCVSCYLGLADVVVVKVVVPVVADIAFGATGGMLLGDRFSDRLDSKEDVAGICGGQPCAQRINRVIHQTYKNNTLPSEWARTPDLWKKHHPDWEYMFWTDKSARSFIAAEYPWFVEFFDSYPFPIQRADAIRYFVLYHYGGVYADLDIQPNEPIDRYLNGTDVALFETPNMGLTNMILASRKHSPFMQCLAAKLVAYRWQYHHLLIPAKGWKILSGTGPSYVWGMASPYLCGSSFGRDEEMRLMSSQLSGRCSLCDGSLEGCGARGVLRHLVGNSWHKSAKDVSLLNFVFLCHPGPFGFGPGLERVPPTTLMHCCKGVALGMSVVLGYAAHMVATKLASRGLRKPSTHATGVHLVVLGCVCGLNFLFVSKWVRVIVGAFLKAFGIAGS